MKTNLRHSDKWKKTAKFWFLCNRAKIRWIREDRNETLMMINLNEDDMRRAAWIDSHFMLWILYNFQFRHSQILLFQFILLFVCILFFFIEFSAWMSNDFFLENIACYLKFIHGVFFLKLSQIGSCVLTQNKLKLFLTNLY